MAYERINWENTPSTATPLNATNLNKMDEGIANLDAKFGNDGILDISKGGTGNNVGYIQTGYKALSVRGSKVTIEGDNNEASANNCHAEGSNNIASRNNAHVEGRYNVASGTSSHAEGESNVASGNYSHAGGEGNVAGYSAQTVVGKYNNNKSNTLFEVGNGASDNDRKNAFEVSGDGISTDDGNTKIRFGNNGLGQYGYYKGSDNNLILFDYAAGTGINITNNVIKNILPQLGDNASLKNIESVTQGQLGMFGGNVRYMLMHFDTDAEPYNDEYTLMLTYSGSVAIMKSAVLYDRVMGMPYSNKIYAETTLLCEVTTDGTGTEADPVHVDVLGVIGGYVTTGWGRQAALGDRATAEGMSTEASGNYAHAHGYQTTASGNQSTAMGYGTTASADGATAMGNGSTASGANSIAGGYNTTASGAVSTAIGTNTQATQQAQLAAGKYNKTNNDALVMVGNGTGASARSNALEVLLNGDVVAGNEIIDGQGNTLSVLAEALTKTASGNPVVITDCAGGRARSLKTTINAIQDLHGYDKPWAGGAYKNKYKMRTTSATVNGITVTPNSDQTVQLSGTATGGSASIPLCDNLSEISTLFGNGGTFTMSLKEGTYGGTLNVSIAYVETQGGATKYLLPNTPTEIPAGSIAMSSNLYVASGTTVQSLSHFAIQLEVGNTATSYAPYRNECPILGRNSVVVERTGRNLFDGTFQPYFISGGTYIYSYDVNCMTAVIPIIGGRKYTVSKTGGNRNIIGELNKAPERGDAVTVLSTSSLPQTVQTSATAKYLLVYVSAVQDTVKLMVEDGETAHDYEPYSGEDFTIQLGQIVYDADINWKTGAMTVKTARPDLGGLTWTADATGVANKNRFYADLSPLAVVADSVNLTSISSQYILLAPGGTYSANADGYTITAASKIYIYDEAQSSATAAEFKAAMSGVQVKYTLATPVTIQLTATQLQLLAGYNRLTIEDGSIEVGYIAKIS